MTSVRAILVDQGAPGRLALGETQAPEPGPSEALVRVAAVSLNRGEVRGAQSANPGYRPGWDLAGTVERAAEDWAGPAAGARVVGMVPSGAWGELVAVPGAFLAELPDAVTFAQASTLLVAGLTAYHALQKRGGLLGRTVLVTGASGGVGYYAVQLARSAGARVVGQVRTAERAELVRTAGAHDVAVGEIGSARQYGPYDLVVDSVGGRTLSGAIPLLAPDGVAVCFGSTDGEDVGFPADSLYGKGGASVYGLLVFHELQREPASVGLSRLLRLVAEGELRPLIVIEEGWEKVGEVAQRLLDRGYAGKAVLRVGG